MSDEELTPRELEELEELAIQKDKDPAYDPIEYDPIEDEWREEEERRQELREKSKGMVLTDIDLPFGRVFWLTVQFFVAGLVLAILIWIIFFLIVSNQ